MASHHAPPADRIIHEPTRNVYNDNNNNNYDDNILTKPSLPSLTLSGRMHEPHVRTTAWTTHPHASLVLFTPRRCRPPRRWQQGHESAVRSSLAVPCSYMQAVCWQAGGGGGRPAILPNLWQAVRSDGTRADRKAGQCPWQGVRRRF